MEALVILRNCEPAVTCRDQLPTAVFDNKADLNALASRASGVYVPDEEHFTNGTSIGETIGKI